MTATVHDFASGKLLKERAATVECVGGQANLFLEVSATGLRPEVLEKVLRKEFKNLKLVNSELLGLSAKSIGVNKLRIMLTFPVNSDFTTHEKITPVCTALANYLATFS
jgi:hypothetical protein